MTTEKSISKDELILLLSRTTNLLIRTIQSMQSTSSPEWFEGFSTWEYDHEENGTEDSVSVKWPNLAILSESLDTVLKDIEKLEQKETQEEVTRLQVDLVNERRMEKSKGN